MAQRQDLCVATIAADQGSRPSRATTRRTNRGNDANTAATVPRPIHSALTSSDDFSARTPDGYTPDDFAADVRELVGHLGVTSAVFVGHSMGTLVVQRLAALHPDLVAGLILIGGLNQLPDDVYDDVWSVVQDLDDPISESFVRDFQSSTLAAPVPDRFFDQFVAESLRAPARVWRAAFAGIRTMPRQVAISAPTLLVWGDRDGLVPRTEQDALLAAIPGARLVVYEGAGHSPNWEQPERVARDIETFLRRPTAARTVA